MLDLSPLVAAVILHGARGPVAEHQARTVLGLSSARFWQTANALIETELSLQLDPTTTYRLRSIRATRQRSTRRAG